MSEQSDRIERTVGVIDERLPLKQVIGLARKYADAMPLTIVENGVTYNMVNARTEIDGYFMKSIAIYQRVAG